MPSCLFSRFTSSIDKRSINICLNFDDFLIRYFESFRLLAVHYWLAKHSQKCAFQIKDDWRTAIAHCEWRRSCENWPREAQHSWGSYNISRFIKRRLKCGGVAGECLHINGGTLQVTRYLVTAQLLQWAHSTRNKVGTPKCFPRQWWFQAMFQFHFWRFLASP